MSDKLYTTAPAADGIDGHTPLSKELDAFAYLDKCGISYEWTAHEPLMTMEDCLAVDENGSFLLEKDNPFRIRSADILSC